MPQVEGRGIRRPIVAEVLMGDTVVLRIDDQDNPEFWLTIQFTLEEWVQVTERYARWVHDTYGPARLVAAGMIDESN